MHTHYLIKRWETPSLDAAALAALLGTSASTVRQNLMVDANFPAPETRGANGRNLWTPAAVYPYVRAYYPRRRHHIPRLWSPAPLNPASFLGAQTVVLPAQEWGPPETYVVHRWRPSDEGGPIAVAYPINTSGHYRSRGRDAVELFLELSGTVDAVVMPYGDASQVTLGNETVWQPAMLVVDTSTILTDEPRKQAVEYGWYEVASLLQTDLPWWPAVLRDRDAMLSWQPGDQVQRVVPASGSYSPQPVQDLIRATPAMSSTLRGIVTALADDIGSDLARSAVGEAKTYPENPGLRHAAVADADPERPRLNRRLVEIALVLHHRLSDHRLADRALTAIGGHPAVTAVMTIDAELAAAEPMVARWCDGLRPVDTAQRDELGYRLLDELRPAATAEPTTPVRQWCTHRSDSNVWAVITEDGTVHTTVGSAVPASGRLISVHITADAAFFETSTDEVWPLPHRHLAGYNAGYEGSGPQDLTRTLSLLRRDAAADVDDAPVVEKDPRIWDIIRKQPLPLLLRMNLASQYPEASDESVDVAATLLADHLDQHEQDTAYTMERFNAARAMGEELAKLLDGDAEE
jgi:hypothetical protein